MSKGSEIEEPRCGATAVWGVLASQRSAGGSGASDADLSLPPFYDWTKVNSDHFL